MENSAVRALEHYRNRELAYRRLWIDGQASDQNIEPIANAYVRNAMQVMTVVGGLSVKAARGLITTSWSKIASEEPPLPPKNRFRLSKL